MGYNGESAEDKKKRWEQAIEEGRKKAESGNRYIQYMNEHFGITEQKKKAAYEASGMDLLRRDLTALDNDLRTKPQTAQRGRVSGMISALQKQRAYFSKYADYFSAEELRGFDDELQRHEARLKGTMTAMEQRAAQTAAKKTTAQSQPLTVAETAQRGAALGAPRGRVEMPIDRTQRRQLGFLTPQEQREAVRRGEELQKTYGDPYDVEHSAKKKQEAEVKARQLYERKKAYIDKKEAEGWNSPQEKENEYRRLEYYSRRLGTAQAEKMRFDAVQKEYGEAKTMENLSARMQEVGQQIAASQQREQQLEAQLRKAKAPSGRRVGNEWVSEEPDTAEIERIGKELKTEQRRQRILEGQQKRVVTDYQAVYYYKYTALQNREDFEEKSQYRTTKKDKVRNGLESTYGDIYYDYINGDPQAQTIVRVQDDNNTKATHEMWKNLPEETVRIFDYLYATEGKDAAYEYLDLTVEKEYTWMQAIGYGVAKGTGLASLYYAGKKGVASFFGGEAEEKSAIMDYRQFNEEAAGAARDYPISYYAGSAVGNLALMAATGGAAGKIVGAAGGAAGGAIGSRVATGALSFATAQAIRDAGDAATGEITGGQFAKNILVGGIQGAAGNLAYELVSSGIAQKLTGARERTLFMEFIRNTAASMSFSTVNQAIGYIAADEKPSAGEVASGLISSFAFAMIDGGLRTLRTTQAAKQELERMRDEVMEQYMLLTQNGKQLSPQQAAERVLAVYQYSRDIQTKLNETYLAGQEDAIAQMQLGLDSAAAWAYDWLSEYQGAAAAGNAPSAQSGGMNGGMPLLPDMTGTGQSEQPAPTQPQGGGTTEQVRQLQTEIAQAMTEGVNAGETAAGNNSKKPAVNSTMSEIRNEQKGAIGNERTENLREGGGRNLRLDSGIQAGSMEKGGSYFPADSGGAGDGESDRAANLRAERINNRIAQFGRLNWSTANSEVIKGGDPETYCAVIPEDRYEPEMQKAAERARQAGVSVTYVAGPLNVTGRDGEYYGAEAVYDPEAKKIVAKADSVSFDPEQLIEHELFHDRANGRPELVRKIADEIRKNFDEAEFNRIAERYLQTYRGAVDGSTETVEEEILADAYAGMNRFRDMNTAQYRETVQRAADSPRYIPPTNENAAALARRGVGDDGKTKLSFAGERAKTANVQALRDAQEMETIGADMESIRKATGWHKGRDGKWRFEIDDSSMRFDRGGERRGIDRSTAMREYNRSWNVLTSREMTEPQRSALRRYINEANSGSFDETLYRQLADEFGSAFEDFAAALEAKKESRDYSEGKVLADYLSHDALFAAYPELRNAGITFEKLEEGAHGYYSAKENAIHLSNKLKNAPEDTLLHEIQHAIQAYEGFSGGSSPEYWARKDYESGTSVSERLQKRYDDLLNGLSRENQNRYIRYTELERELGRLFLAEENSEDGRKYARLEAEQDKLYEELWQNEWFRKLLDLDRKIGNPSEEYYRLYRNTAGEIEARDSENRRGLTAEQRKETAPDYGNEDTVLAEGSQGYSLSRDEEKGVKEQLREHQSELNRIEPVAVIENGGWNGMSTGDFRKKIINDLQSSGYKVDRKGFGIIEFDERALNTSLNYTKTDAEAAAYQAIPKVLKRGIEISGHENHKGRGYGTVTIAAPIELNGKRGNMAIVVKMTNANRYKMHRILTPEGKAFELQKKADAVPNSVGGFTEGANSSGEVAPTISTASADSIHRNSKKSQGGGVKFSLATESDGEYLSLAEKYRDGTASEEETKRLQEMVDAAAEAALEDSEARMEPWNRWDGGGKLVKVYHTTNEQFTVFDRKKLGGMTDNNASTPLLAATAHVGHWFNTSATKVKERARTKHTIAAYLDIKRPYVAGTVEGLANDIAEYTDAEPGEDWDYEGYTPKRIAKRFIEHLEWNGYDGVVVSKDEEFGGTSFVVLNSDQIKSADPVTYDNEGQIIPLSERFRKDRKGKNAWKNKDIRFSLAASETVGKLTAANNLSEADLREGLSSGAITLSDDDREGEVSVIYRSGSEVNGTVPIGSVQQVILPRSSKLGTFRDLAEMGIDVTDYTANDEYGRERHVNKALGMEGRQTQSEAMQTAAQRIEKERIESLSDADAPREKTEKQDERTEQIEEMRRSPNDVRRRIGGALEAYMKRQQDLKEEKKRFGTDYGFQKPLWSRSTKLSPMEAVETLESATGHQWSIQRRRDGTWKAVQQEGLALAPRYSKEEALRRLEDNKRSTLADPVVSTTAEGTAKKAFVATPAMEKLGIKIDGSVADYEATPEILASARARKQIESSVKKLMKRNGWENSSAEAKFAWCIANGKVSVQDIPKRMDYRAVNELANLYMSERMLGEDLLTMRKRAIRNGVLDEVMRLFPSEKSIKAGTATFRSESLLTMNYRTARRSMLRIFGDEAGEKINKYLFDPVIRNTAEQMRWTNRQLDRMRTFESADGKQEKLNKAESKYVHMLLDLEGYREKINRSENKQSLLAAAENLTGKLGKTDDLQSAVRDEAREFGLGSEETAWVTKYAQYLAEKEKAGEKDSGIDTEKCERARAAYRKAFDEYYDAIVDLLVAHGEQPIGKIEFYAPHMTTNDKVNLLSNLLETMGFNENATTLPASIAGITEDLRPNKRWTPFFQHRTGDKTEYDIVGAFESYLSYIGDVIFHIDDIRKLRITESFLRQGVAGDFTGALDTALRMSRSGDLEERERFLTDVGQIGDDELLTEQEIGQRIDNLIEELIGEQKNNTRYSGLVDWLKTYTDILAGKQYSGDRGLEHAVGRVGPGAKILNVMNQAGRLFGMSKVAGNISTILNQSAQLPLLMATRSKRSILRAIGEFTGGKLKDFTLESDFLTGKRGISYINSKTSEKILSGMFAGAEFTDRLLSTIAARAAYLDAVTGQKGLQQMDHEDAMRFADSYARGLMGDRTKGAKPVAFHSKNPLMQMVNRFQIENLNSWEFLLRDVPEEFRKVQREHGKAAAIKALIGVIVETLIAAFIMNRLTEEAYGGTPAPFDLIGLSANFIASGNGLSTNDGIRYLFNQASKELFGEEVFENVPEPSESFDLGRAASDTAQNVSNDIPFVSNIASIVGWGDKTMPLPDLYGSGKEIVDAIRESGWFSRDANLAALGFLAEILPGGNQMQKTAKGLLALKEGGRVTGRTDKERLQFATDDDIANVIRQALFGVYSTPEAKAFYASGRSGLSTKQTTLWRELREDGVDGTELYETMQTIRAIDKRDDLTTPQQGAAKRKLINEANLTDGQKARLYSIMISDSRDDDFGQMMEAEMSWAQIMEAYEKYKELYDDEELSAAEQALEMAQWIEKQKYSKTQKQLVKEAFKFYSFAPANTDVYDNYVAAGVSPDEAKRIVAQTKKNAGDDSVATEDKVNAILGQKMSEKKTYAALGTVLSEGAYEKLTEAYRAGISCEVFFKFYRMAQEATSERDGDGKEIKGKTRKDKIIAYIDSLNQTDEQKNTLLLTEYPKAKPEDMRWSKTKWNGN